jgi:tripartite-type tricarboxylate transporter receptor subunit TctC
LSEEVAQALRQPDVAERADTLGFELIGTSPEAFGAFQRKEIARWAAVVRAAGIEIE